MRWTATGLLLFFLIPNTGECGGPPPRPAYLDWTKTGSTVLDVKKIILECGWPSPDPWLSQIEAAGMTINDQVLSRLCMIRSGFVSRDSRDMKIYYCIDDPTLPACQPGAIIPTPSVERRLNSWWCNPDYTFYGCVQRDDRFPERCVKYDYRKRDNLPPECLP